MNAYIDWVPQCDQKYFKSLGQAFKGVFCAWQIFLPYLGYWANENCLRNRASAHKKGHFNKSGMGQARAQRPRLIF